MKPNLVSLGFAFCLSALTLCGHVNASTNGKEVGTAATINIVFVTDLSGSMKTNQLVEPTQEFLHTFFDQLYTGDRVGLISFGSYLGVERPVNVSERNRDSDLILLKNTVSNYQFVQAKTYTSSGLAAGCSALKLDQGPKVLILLTDGKEEIPDGMPPLWNELPNHCVGIAIHVVALTAQSMPTVQQVGQKLGATVHDATRKSLADIGNDIRAGIRVFVTADKESFELGNLKLNEAVEMRAQFSLTGASSQVTLKPVGKFPAGANFTCKEFTVPGDMRCQLVLTDSLQPGVYSGTIHFEPTVGNLAVVTPTLEINFSRGLLKVQVSEESLSLGAMRPGATQTISVDFTAEESAEPQPLALVVHGLPDGMLMVEPAQIMVPAKNVELRFTFNGGDPGSYTGQLTLLRQSTTMVVEPAAISLSFFRRTWFWEKFSAYWYFIIPGAVFLLLLFGGIYFRKVVVPRREAAERPYLKGRLEYSDGRVVHLDIKLQEQTVDGFTFRATGTSQQLTLQVVSTERCKVRRMRGDSTTLMPKVSHSLKDRDQLQTREGEVLFTFHCLGL